jgi:hypothetical protein
VNPFRQSTHLQILPDVLCGALLQAGADLGRIGGSDRSLIADMPTAHVCATLRHAAIGGWVFGFSHDSSHSLVVFILHYNAFPNKCLSLEFKYFCRKRD